MSLNLTKFSFAQKNCKWLGHKITPTGITPLVRKTESNEILTSERYGEHFPEVVYGLHTQLTQKFASAS